MPPAPDAPTTTEPINGSMHRGAVAIVRAFGKEPPTWVSVLFVVGLLGTAAYGNPEMAQTVAVYAVLAVVIPLSWLWAHILIVTAAVVLLYLALLIDRLRVGHNDQERRLQQLERTARGTLNR